MAEASVAAAAKTTEKGTVKSNGAGKVGEQKAVAEAKPKAAPKPKPPEFEVAHIEYIVIDPALDTVTSTKQKSDKQGFGRSNRNRTERLKGARLYRTGSDRVTIQDDNGDEITLKISTFEKILAKSRDLSVTKELPVFS